MSKVKYSLDKRGNGIFNPVIVRISHAGQQVKRSTGIKLQPADWDEGSQYPKDKLSFEFENLARLESDIMNRVTKDSNTDLIKLIDSVMKKPEIKPNEDRLVNLIASFVESKSNQYSNSTILHYEKLSELIKSYCIGNKTKCFISNIDKSWVSKLVDYMSYEVKYSNSTTEVMLKKLISVLNYYDKPVKFKISDVMRGMKKAKSVNGPKPYLTFKQIADIYEFVIDTYGDISIEANVFRIFMFGAYTGARFNELMNLKPSMVSKEGVLTYTTSKNGKRISVPLNDWCMLYVDRKEDRILSEISNKKCNTVLTRILTDFGMTQTKTVVRFNGKNREEEDKTLAELIVFHSSRRSYISNLLDHGLPIKDVALVTGISITTLINYYASSDQNEVNEKVLSILNR